MRYDTGRPEDSDTASVRNTDALTHRRSPTRACLLSTRAVDARARVEVARVRATSLLRDGNARLLASGNAKTPASLRLPEFRRRVGRTARDFFFTSGDPGRLVNAESGTMVRLWSDFQHLQRAGAYHPERHNAQGERHGRWCPRLRVDCVNRPTRYSRSRRAQSLGSPGFPGRCQTRH